MTARRPVATMGQVDGLSDALSALRQQSVACLGDSTTSPAANWDYVGFIWPTWLRYMTGLEIIPAGVAGDSTEDMLLRLDADVIDKHPGTCLILAGTNNMTTADAQARLDVVTMTTRLLEAGIRPVFLTVLPSATVSANTAIKAHNRWLVEHCRTYGLQMIDLFTLLSNTDGTPKTGALSDNTHPSPQGKFDIAEYIASKLAYTTVDFPEYLLNGEANACSNGLFADANADGTADGIELYAPTGGTATFTVEENSAGGNWQKVERSTTATDAHSRMYFAVAVTAGETLQIAYDLKTNADLAANSLNFNIFYTPSGAKALLAGMVVPLTESFRFCHSVVVPAGATQAGFYLDCDGKDATDYSIGRLSITRSPSV